MEPPKSALEAASLVFVSLVVLAGRYAFNFLSKIGNASTSKDVGLEVPSGQEGRTSTVSTAGMNAESAKAIAELAASVAKLAERTAKLEAMLQDEREHSQKQDERITRMAHVINRLRSKMTPIVSWIDKGATPPAPIIDDELRSLLADAAE